MLFRRPDIWDKPITLFNIDGIAVHMIQSINTNYAIFKTMYESEKLVVPLKGFLEFRNIYANEKDIVYVPRGFEEIEIVFEKNSVIFVIEAISNEVFEPYVKRFREARYVDVGSGLSRRRRYILIDVDDKSSRFLAGYTEGCPGCWGSYPPHRHDDKYEIFVYYDVEPGFGIQLLIDDNHREAYIVKNFDVFLAKRGYHPNVSTPLNGLKYLWVMIVVEGERNFSMSIHELFVEKSV